MEFLPILVLLGAAYFFMIMPQQRRMKAHQALLNSLEPGDVVVTSGGIHGAIAEVEDTVVWLEVAPEVELKVSKSAIAERLSDDDTDDDDTDDDDTDHDENADDDVMAEADVDDGDI